MRFGGDSPFPLRFGGGAPIVSTILEGLNAARGTAYDTSHDSNVYAENIAHARAIAGLWSTNQRAANQFDPTRMTSMLPRWEKIMRIVPSDAATMAARRRAVAARWARVGVITTDQSLVDEIVSLIGSTFVAMTSATVGTALTFWPSGTPSAAWPWYSTISLVSVQVVQLPSMPDAEFYESVAQIAPMLDARLPAWATWQWWRNDLVTGLPGFFLDRAVNLDNCVFDV